MAAGLGTHGGAGNGRKQSEPLPLGVLLVAQGTAAIPLLVIGLLLALAAMPGWIELLLMWPNRVGGVAAVCGEAFRPYSGVLANQDVPPPCRWR
jgi:hypothetical protein